MEIMETMTAYSFTLLGTGFVIGLMHAIEADHLAAISTIVGERKNLWHSSLIGALWGVGHTTSLLLVGVLVLFFKLPISPRVESALEFCVGLMLVGLGVNTFVKFVRGGRLHLHQHEHGGHKHIHPHLHDKLEIVSPSSHDESHQGYKIGHRPLWIGMLHGFAGSAALLMVGLLTTIQSPTLGLVYIAVFGIGSIGGMMFMSSLLSLPFHLTAHRFTRLNGVVRILAAVFSLSIGLMMLWEKGRELVA